MENRKSATGSLGLLVVGKYFAARLAPVVFTKITKRSRRLQAALCHISRRDCQIAIWRNVPVIRHLHFLPVLDGTTEGRRKKSGLAAVIERESHSGNEQDLLPLEEQSRILRFTEIATVVELQLADLHVPVIVAGSASGVSGIRSAISVRSQKLQAACLPARAAVGQQILGGKEKPGTGIELELEIRPGKQVAIAQDPDVAAGVQFVSHDTIVDAVGLDNRVLLAQLRVAFDAGGAPGFA